jgi:hypothetical protein
MTLAELAEYWLNGESLVTVTVEGLAIQDRPARITSVAANGVCVDLWEPVRGTCQPWPFAWSRDAERWTWHGSKKKVTISKRVKG